MDKLQLQKVTTNAILECPYYILIPIRSCKDYHRDIFEFFIALYLLQHRYTINFRHVQVEQDHIGLRILLLGCVVTAVIEEIKCLFAVFAYNQPVRDFKISYAD